MKLGIKIGPGDDWKNRIESTHPHMVEVWFDINRLDEYQEMFAYLKTQPIDVGLHFWGALTDGTCTNLAYPDDAIVNETLRLMIKTIDVAAQWQFDYVNIHPGSRANLGINFKEGSLRILKDPVDPDLSDKLFLKNVHILDTHARQQHIVLTIETVPPRTGTNWHDPSSRTNSAPIYQLPVSTIQIAADDGLWIANDFVHTATNKISDNAQDVWTFLLDSTKALAPQTRLIHLGFLIPPYNGTDIHDMLDNPILDTDLAIPNKNQMIELLNIFYNRDDIWILVEPKEDHIKNYFLAQKFLMNASVLTK